MPKLFYPFDAQAYWMRIGMTTMLGGMTTLVGLMIVMANLGVPREFLSGILVPPMLLLLVWEIAIPLFVRQRVDDGLGIDETGLVRIIRAREERWNWDQMSEFRLHSRWHPVCLLIGRSISFRGRRPPRRSRLVGLLNRVAFGGRNLAFGDNYLVVSEELADRLNRYRDMAMGATPKPPGEGSVPAPDPALFTARDTLDAAKRSKAILILMGTTLASAAAMLGIVMWSDDVLPASVEEFLSSDRIVAMLVPAFLVVVQSLSQHFWQSSPATNLVLAAAGGLHSRKGLQRRHWRWDEIADIALKKAPAGKGRASGETVSFRAVHDGTKPGRPAAEDSAGVLMTAFDDAYDASPDEIARRLAIWAAWGRAHAGPVTPDAPAEVAPAGRPEAPAMRFRPQMGLRSGALRAAAMLAFWVSLAGSMAITLSINLIAHDEAIRPGVLLAAYGVSLLLLLGGIAMIGFVVSVGANYLDVDASALVYRRLGWRTRYGWHELASFELYTARLRWSGVPRSIIVFAAPRDDRISRYLRWAYRIGGIQPRIVIEDVYDIAVSEILAVLERHRRQGGRAARRAVD